MYIKYTYYCDYLMHELSLKEKRLQTFDDIIGRSRIMQDVFWKIKLAAENDVTVLINGESGTGKELAARSIHRRSTRSQAPFIAVNMGAMAKELIPSELFGHEKGSFTGATDVKEGVFQIAHEGTLFLDEISSMDYKAQTSLLRILENREFRRIGGKQNLKTNARIIAATNKDLRNEIEHGSFRRDLFYRLEVFTITMPLLRDRWEDIPLLVWEFVRLFNNEMHKQVSKVTKETMDYLIRYQWPGNIRELKNVIQRALLLSSGTSLTPDLLPERVLAETSQKKSISIEIGLPLKEIEKRYIARTLWWLGGNKLKAAKFLGISRRALYNKIEEYNL